MTKKLVDSELLKWALRVVDTVLPDYQEYRRLSDSLRAALDVPQQPEHPGCDHCNHPMFAAMRCDVCGKVHSTDDEPQQEAVTERGPWRARQTGEETPRVFVESDDFTHDVRLYVNGDFADHEQRMAYASEIASRLNASPAPSVPEGWQLVPKEPTPEMMVAHDDLLMQGVPRGRNLIYKAMLSAAPKAPTTDDRKDAEQHQEKDR